MIVATGDQDPDIDVRSVNELKDGTFVYELQDTLFHHRQQIEELFRSNNEHAINEPLGPPLDLTSFKLRPASTKFNAAKPPSIIPTISGSPAQPPAPPTFSVVGPPGHRPSFHSNGVFGPPAAPPSPPVSIRVIDDVPRPPAPPPKELITNLRDAQPPAPPPSTNRQAIGPPGFQSPLDLPPSAPVFPPAPPPSSLFEDNHAQVRQEQRSGRRA